MIDPVTEWKQKVVQANIGDVLVYHRGLLGADMTSSPSLTNIAGFARGLFIMGRVGLRQTRKKHTVETLGGSFVHEATEYSMKLLQPVHPNDFDTARKVNLNDYKQ